jgi:hypothetical protein
MTTAAPSVTRRTAAPHRPPSPGARTLGAPETRRRTAAGVLLVLSGLVATPALWLSLAWGAWAAGWPALAAPVGLLGLLPLVLLGGSLRAVGAVARPRLT